MLSAISYRKFKSIFCSVLDIRMVEKAYRVIEFNPWTWQINYLFLEFGFCVNSFFPMMSQIKLVISEFLSNYDGSIFCFDNFSITMRRCQSTIFFSVINGHSRRVKCVRLNLQNSLDYVPTSDVIIPRKFRMMKKNSWRQRQASTTEIKQINTSHTSSNQFKLSWARPFVWHSHTQVWFSMATNEMKFCRATFRFEIPAT